MPPSQAQKQSPGAKRDNAPHPEAETLNQPVSGPTEGFETAAAGRPEQPGIEEVVATSPVPAAAPEPSVSNPIAPDPSAPEPTASEPSAPEPAAPEPAAPEPAAPEPSAPESFEELPDSAPPASSPGQNIPRFSLWLMCLSQLSGSLQRLHSLPDQDQMRADFIANPCELLLIYPCNHRSHEMQSWRACPAVLLCCKSNHKHESTLCPWRHTCHSNLTASSLKLQFNLNVSKQQQAADSSSSHLCP